MRTLIFALGVLLVSGSVLAKDKADPYEDFRSETERYEFTYDETLGPQWKEANIKVPPVALDKLRELDIDHGPIGVTLFLDASTLNINESDRVTRYWYVAKRDGRPVSIAYEALRCATREVKQIAYASSRHPDKIKYLGKPKWRPVGYGGSKDFHVELAEDYLCAGTVRPSWPGLVDITIIIIPTLNIPITSNEQLRRLSD